MVQDLLALVIAIDGGAGTGKGAVARYIAQLLGWHYLESGLLYRILGVLCQRLGVLDKPEEIIKVAQSLSFEVDGEKVFINGIDETEIVRGQDGGTWASIVAPIAEVREALREFQLAMQKAPGLVAEGRDMCWLFETLHRFFLVCSAEIRAKRRVLQYQNMGLPADYDTILQEILDRDERDKGRKVAALKAHPDAVVIDTGDKTVEEVAQIIIEKAGLADLIKVS